MFEHHQVQEEPKMQEVHNQAKNVKVLKYRDAVLACDCVYVGTIVYHYLVDTNFLQTFLELDNARACIRREDFIPNVFRKEPRNLAILNNAQTCGR